MTARTAGPGGRTFVAGDGSTAIDTAQYGMVTLLVPSGTSISSILVGEAEDTVDVSPESSIISPDTGEVYDIATAPTEDTILSYIGNYRYVLAPSGVTVLLEEARRTTPIEAPPETGTTGSRDPQEIIDGATTATVRLSSDYSGSLTVPAGKTITLVLNGHTVESSEGDAISCEGTLTITGSGTVRSTGGRCILNSGTLTIRGGTYDATGGTYAVESSGDLTISGGTFSAGEEDCICIRGGTAAISGGTYTSEQYSALWTPGGTVTVTGGTFTSTSCSKCFTKYGYTISNNGAAMEVSNAVVTGTQGAIAASSGTTVIHSGTYTTVDCADSHGAAWHALYVAGETGVTCCTVYGGTFHADSRACVRVGNSNDGGNQDAASLVIHDGTFGTGGGSSIACIDVDGDTASVPSCAVLGGTYDREIPAGIVVDGYTLTGDAGGWTVVPS